EAERMCLVGHLDKVDMVRKVRQLLVWPENLDGFRRLVRSKSTIPLRLEAELAVRMAESVDVVGCVEVRLQVEPAVLTQAFESAIALSREHEVDVLALAQSETGLIEDTQALCQFFDDINVGARAFRRIDEPGADHKILMPAALVDVVMLHEHRSRKDHVREFSGVRHELLMDAGEEVVAEEASFHK